MANRREQAKIEIRSGENEYAVRVLAINSVCGICSTGRICTDLAQVLIENGHECRIAYGRENTAEKYQAISYRIGSNADVRLHAAKSRVFDCAGLGSKRATLRLVKEIRCYKPDVIHLHNLHGYYLNIEILFDFLAEANIPVVWTLHDCWAFTGHCTHFSAVGCEHWREGCFDCTQTRRYPSCFLLDRSSENWERKRNLFTSINNMALVTPSEWLAKLVKESFLRNYPVYAIPNGVDLSAFKPTNGSFREQHGLQDKRIVLGVASVWDTRKGFDDFIGLSRVLDNQTQIVLVGLNKKQLKKLPDNIIGIPKTNDASQLAEIYTTADVFINPSKEETMGMTTVEAMACGTPVIVSNCTAVPETVASNSGIVLDDFSPESLKLCINKIYDLKLNPRTNAEKYEKKRQWMKYLELYESLVEA